MSAVVKSTSTTFRAFLFGVMRLEWNGKNCSLPTSATARSLFAFLLLNRQTPQPRNALIGIFWPEMSEERARRALSQALWQIRRSLPDLLEVTAENISISANATLWVDAEEFKQMVNTTLDAAPLDEIARQNLEKALDLYCADFLEGIYHDWALLERERLRELYLQALERLGQLEKTAGRYAIALDLALRLSHANPLNEAAHRETMRLHLLLDQPEAALRQFELCRQILRQEIDVEPDAETRALAEEINHRSAASPPAIKPGKERGNLIPTPLVGREKDRATLLPLVEGVFKKLGGLILLEGEAGVGKTRLLQDVARDAEWRGAQVLWGNVHEAQGLKPYAPLAEALQIGLSPLRVAQIRQVVDRVWLQTITPLLTPHPALPMLEPAPPLQPAQEQARLIEAIIHFLEGWAGIVPLIIILEDLHWADHDTLNFLPTLTRRLNTLGILMICSYRGAEARANPQVWEALQAVSRGNLLERLILSRLDKQATGELIRRSLGLASPAPLFEERLYCETDGNPLFVLETLRALQDGGQLKREVRGGWSTPWDKTTADYAELSLPSVVEKVITSRLERLPHPLRQLLEIMAALGSQFDFTTLATISGLEISTVLETTRELIHRSFLKETANGYRFEHDKIHQVVYEKIEVKKRVQIHRMIAAALEKTCPAEINALAYHFWRGEQWEQAVHYNWKASEAAMAIHANQEARIYLTCTLDVLDKLPAQTGQVQRAELLKARETVNGLLGYRTAQKADLYELDHILKNPTERAAQALRWAQYYEVTSDYPAAIQAAQEAIEWAAQENDRSIMIAGQIISGRALNMQANIQDTQAMLTSALENARASKDALQETICLHALARFYYDHQNRYEEALTCCQQALDIVQTLANSEMEANVRHMMSNVLSDLGHVDQTLQEKLAVLRLRRKIGDRRGEAMILYSLAVYYRDRGDNEASLKHTQESLAIAETNGDQRLEAYDRTYLGLLLEESNPQESYKQYAHALDIRRQIGQAALAMDTLAGLARACLQLGQIQQAKAHIMEALDWVTEHGTFGVGDIGLVYLAAFNVFKATGEHDRARQIIQTAYEVLMARAATLPNDEARRIFLASPPQHEQIINHYRKIQGRQITVCLPRAGSAIESVEVLWTPDTPGDESIPDKVARRRHRLQRLLEEANEQGADPGYKHLAEALEVGLRTIERDMAELSNK